MKKIYNPIKAFIAFLVLMGFQAVAQPMSGVYTINSGLSTGGTNFQTFTAFATALSTNGVNGPVTVNVTNGTYNEQVTFPQITGMSATNNVVINGNGALLTFNASSSAAHTMWLNGIDNLTVNNLQMQGTNSTYAMVCVLSNNSNNNVFSACTFSCPYNGTSSYQVPFSFSGSNSSLSGNTSTGNNNTVSTCTLYSGYYAIFHYGLTSAPYTSGNTFVGCYITDFYLYGIYCYYSKNLTFKNNVVDRLTRTNLTTTYLTYGLYSQGLNFDGNLFHKLYEGNTSYTGTLYGIYYFGYYNPSYGNRNYFTNNIIKDINFNGTIYMFAYAYYSDCDFYHNTISLDQTSSTAGGSTYVWYYCYAGTGSYGPTTNRWKNNLVTITRGGSGSKYVVYFGGTTQGTEFDYNNFYVNSAGGGNNYAYYQTLATTWLQWQSQNADANGLNLDPQYTSLSTGDLHPTNASLNNKGLPLGVMFDQQLAVRSQTAPDIGALEFLTPICSGTPTNTISGPTYSLCPGESANFAINNLSSDLGITYSWQVSTTSQVGPWTPLNATSVTYTAPSVTQQSWYSVVITCTASGGANTAVMQVNIASPTSSTVPYYENFEGIGRPNRLPNCSWSAPSLGAAATTYTSAQNGNRLANSGSSFASFDNTQSTNYFYTNPIQMEPGITYSASLWYLTDLTGATNWTDLSIMIGTTQATSGLSTIVSSNGPAVSPVYKGLGGTFTVGASGQYYIAVRGTNSGSGATYLSWDDLRIDIPCTPSLNAVALAVAVPNMTVCQGTSLVMSASGANTYTWNTGNTTAVLSQTPIVNPSLYSVTGTNTLTGCTATKNLIINVKPAPSVVATAYPPVACAGQNVILTAGGAGNYAWSTSQQGANITVNPTSGTSYTVIGTNAQNCSSSAVVNVAVNPNPAINVSAPQMICVGEVATLMASGAQSYQWMANTAFIQSNPAMVSPMIGTTTYTVVGTDANGCTGQAVVNLVVDACTGISGNSIKGLNVYPNPTNGNLTIELGSTGASNIVVVDVTGRKVLSTAVNADKTDIDLSSFAAGVYYVKIQTASQVETVKVVKN